MEDDKKKVNNEEVKNEDETKKDPRSLGEKIGDGVEDALDSVQDIFYGDDFQNDIPATMVNGNGRKVVNKVQTRRNFNKRLFSKGGWKLLVFGILLILLIGWILGW